MAGMSFNTTEERKRLAKILAARLNKADVQTLINDLLQREIDKYFSKPLQAALLSEPEPESDIGPVPFQGRETSPETGDSDNHLTNTPSRRERKAA